MSENVGKSKTVRITFYDDLKKTSDVSKRTMATTLEIAWKEFKKSKRYAKMMLGVE